MKTGFEIQDSFFDIPMEIWKPEACGQNLTIAALLA